MTATRWDEEYKIINKKLSVEEVVMLPLLQLYNRFPADFTTKYPKYCKLTNYEAHATGLKHEIKNNFEILFA